MSMLYLTDAAPDLVAPRPERDGDPMTVVVDLANQAAARMERAEAGLKEALERIEAMKDVRNVLVVALDQLLDGGDDIDRDNARAALHYARTHQ